MIKFKTEKEVKIMTEGGRILSEILASLEKSVIPGMSTMDLNILAEELIEKAGAQSSFKGYRGFPTALCTSINDEVVHGVPSNRIVRVGDILKIDLGILYKGYHTDSATTVLVGFNPKDKTHLHRMRLLDVTKEALKIGIENAIVGNTLGDLGYAIEQYVKAEGFSVVKDLVGHGIGKTIHEDPEVPNYGHKGKGEKIVVGMVIAIEPMVTTGVDTTIGGEDGFVFKTEDGSMSAHFEHTIAITNGEPIILTQ